MNALTPEQREIVARLQPGRLMICEGQGDPNSDGCGGQGYTGAAGQEPCPHCYGAGVMTPELRVALAPAPSPEAGAGGDLGELGREQIAAALFESDNPGNDHLTWAEWLAYVDKHGSSTILLKEIDACRRRADVVLALLSDRSGKLVASTQHPLARKGEV